MYINKKLISIFLEIINYGLGGLAILLLVSNGIILAMTSMFSMYIVLFIKDIVERK